MGFLGDIYQIVIVFISSVLATLIVLKILEVLKRREQERPLNKILNFGDDELLFVFTHREMEEVILPRTSTEDFLAINNFISALLKISWKNKIGVRDPAHLTDQDKRRNLVVICSPKSNTFTDEIQKLLEDHSTFYRFEKQENSGKWYITDNLGTWESKSFGQIEDFLAGGGRKANIPELLLDDVAVINKISNPWNKTNKIFIIAGIRGIGTWGAAECIKKNWKQLYSRLPVKQKEKNCDFSALLSIRFHNCDITNTEVNNLYVLREQKNS